MAKRSTMNVSLTPELERYVQRQVASGRYGSASEVVRESLRLMQRRGYPIVRDAEELRRAVALGLEQAQRGEVVDGKRAIHRIRADLKRRLAAQGRRRAG